VRACYIALQKFTRTQEIAGECAGSQRLYQAPAVAALLLFWCTLVAAAVQQTSFLRPNLLLKVVPKVKEADEETGMPLFMVRLISYIKDRPQHIAAAAAAVARQAKDAATQAAQMAACGLAAGQQQEQLRAQAAAAAATAAAAEAEAAAAADAAAGKVGSSGLSCSGIVYCLSRKEAEGVAAALDQEGGIKAKHYHAGMTPKQRTEVGGA
jgi:superfamily II DNA helicase RecQ